MHVYISFSLPFLSLTYINKCLSRLYVSQPWNLDFLSCSQPFCWRTAVEITAKPSVQKRFCETHNPDCHQIDNMNNANVSMSPFLFLVLPVNSKIPSNPITETTSRQELRQQRSFQPLRSWARSQDTFLSSRSMFSERQRLILGLQRKSQWDHYSGRC